MITPRELFALAIEWGVSEAVVERDYVIGSVLRGFAADAALRKRVALSGGTCLKKCYLETWRFPDRIDVRAERDMMEEAMSGIIALAAREGEREGIGFLPEQGPMERFPDGRMECDLLFRSSLDPAAVRRLRVSVSDMPLLEPAVPRDVFHFYGGGVSGTFAVPCVTVRELLADMLLALCRDGRPADLYDAVHLSWRGAALLGSPRELHALLEAKARRAGLPPASYQRIAERMEDIRGAWHRELEHQMRAVPPFEHFWGALPELFGWLEGATDMRVAPVMLIDETGLDRQWKPPPAAWQWGADVPLEAIRFAAVNRLCIELGYAGSSRLVEPYALRFTSDGHLLLSARRVDTQEIRTYRLDRIESIRVTSIPFVPVYTIEMSTGGPFLVQPPIASVRGPRARTEKKGKRREETETENETKSVPFQSRA